MARIIIDARVLDDRGNPVPGLTADDFKVKIDGKIVRVETATWVGGPETDLVAAPVSPALGEAGAALTPGRLIVFLFQKDLEPSRIVGLMRMLLKSRNLLETLTPNDRVAILSFDSHLKIWTDFTNDRSASTVCSPTACCSSGRRRCRRLRRLRWWSASIQTKGDGCTASNARSN